MTVQEEEDRTARYWPPGDSSREWEAGGRGGEGCSATCGSCGCSFKVRRLRQSTEADGVRTNNWPEADDRQSRAVRGDTGGEEAEEKKDWKTGWDEREEEKVSRDASGGGGGAGCCGAGEWKGCAAVVLADARGSGVVNAECCSRVDVTELRLAMTC